MEVVVASDPLVDVDLAGGFLAPSSVDEHNSFADRVGHNFGHKRNEQARGKDSCPRGGQRTSQIQQPRGGSSRTRIEKEVDCNLLFRGGEGSGWQWLAVDVTFGSTASGLRLDGRRHTALGRGKRLAHVDGGVHDERHRGIRVVEKETSVVAANKHKEPDDRSGVGKNENNNNDNERRRQRRKKKKRNGKKTKGQRREGRM